MGDDECVNPVDVHFEDVCAFLAVRLAGVAPKVTYLLVLWF